MARGTTKWQSLLKTDLHVKRLNSLTKNRSLPLDHKLKRKPVWIFVLFVSMKINQWKAYKLKIKYFNTTPNNSATNYTLLTIGTERLACKLITFLHVIQRSWFDSNQRISQSFKVISHWFDQNVPFFRVTAVKKERIIFLFKKRYRYISFVEYFTCRSFF